MDAVFAEMIRGDIGDDGGVAMGDRKSPAQHAAARGLQYRSLRTALAQGGTRARRTGTIAARQASSPCVKVVSIPLPE